MGPLEGVRVLGTLRDIDAGTRRAIYGLSDEADRREPLVGHVRTFLEDPGPGNGTVVIPYSGTDGRLWNLEVRLRRVL